VELFFLGVSLTQTIDPTAGGVKEVAEDSGRGDWWMFGRDRTHSRRSVYSGPPIAMTKWFRDTRAAVTSSPAFAQDGTVYIGSNNNTLYALLWEDQNDDGEADSKWEYTTVGDIKSSPAVGSDGTVYVGTWGGDDGDYLYAINSDGTLKWMYYVGSGIEASPVISENGTIYITSLFPAKLYALRDGGQNNPILKWSLDLSSFINHSSPAIGADGTIYFGSGNQMYAVTDTGSTGEIMWTRTVAGVMVFSSPAIAQEGAYEYIYVGTVDKGAGSLVKLRALDGHLIWRYHVQGPVESSPGIAANGTIVFGSFDNYIYALNPDGSLKWRYLTGGDISSSPAISSTGNVYIGCDDGNLYGLGPDGELLFAYPTQGAIDSSPAIQDVDPWGGGFVFFGSNDGKVYAVGGP